MTDRRHLATAGAATWAAVGGAVALSQLSAVNGDALLVVGLFSVLGPVLAIAASAAAARGSLRLAGALLVLSALATPTYFAYPLNLAALAAGAWLLATAPSRRPSRDRMQTA